MLEGAKREFIGCAGTRDISLPLPGLAQKHATNRGLPEGLRRSGIAPVLRVVASLSDKFVGIGHVELSLIQAERLGPAQLGDNFRTRARAARRRATNDSMFLVHDGQAG